MNPRFLIMIGLVVGSTVGSLLPSLWGAGWFSLWSIVLGGVGGLAGIWIGFRAAKLLS